MDRLDTEVGVDAGVAPARFGAWQALLAFAIVLGAQFATGIAMIVVGMVISIIGGLNPNDQAATTLAVDRMMPGLLLAGAVVTLLMTWAMLRVFAPDLARDRTPNGLGLLSPGARRLALWAIAGVALNAAYQGLVRFIPTTWEGGPLAKMAAGGSAGRFVIAVVAVLLAPYMEELLFRGLMLRGLLASWGVTAAGIVVTLLFFALHLFDTAGYWPAMLAILSLAVLALVARLRSGSVYAAVAAHTGYNLTAIVTLYLL
ncbi:MAG TPA: CPBP family intramembrane glutamic endopeptidase [Thermoanaerobaculia bacterium]|jgi:membrane protease YdiL (CAAX protease family)